MPELPVILLFLSAALVLFLMPGPVVMYTVARTLAQGRAAGLVSVLAAAIGDLTHVLAAALGLSALLASSPLAFQLVRYAGAAYLVFLGVRTWLSREAQGGPGIVPQQPLRRVFGQGVLVAVLNPKTALFFLAFLPQFVRPGRGTVALQILVLGALFVLLGMVMNTLWALAAGAVSSFASRGGQAGRASRTLAGGVYVALGVVAAVTGGGGNLG
ncbi:MAG: LysE family translocator [Anaerolineae bacterium]